MGAMSGDYVELASALEEVAGGLRKYTVILGRLLGETEDERRASARLLKGLTSTEIRVALEEYVDRRRRL
jgi:hypothetical protein